MISNIILKDVTKLFSSTNTNVNVLRGINLTITRGDHVVIIGPSGCGKSTLFSIIGAVDLPTEGEIWYEDTMLSRMSHQDRINLRKQNIGLVFQNFALINWLTVAENLDHNMLIHGIKDEEKRHQKISTLLDKIELKKRENYFPSELSGGEKQRIAIARALITNPSIILADEPTGRLDVENANKIWGFLTKLVEESNIILIVFTHDSRIDLTKNDIKLYFLEYGNLQRIN